MITGARWCDIPREPQFAARSTAHRWLQRWAWDGTWERLQTGLLLAADYATKIDWNRASVDGSFSPFSGRGRW